MANKSSPLVQAAEVPDLVAAGTRTPGDADKGEIAEFLAGAAHAVGHTTCGGGGVERGHELVLIKALQDFRAIFSS